ncbi:MAG: NADP(H)-dependent aldo-keto reductase [Bdellovibrionales bacterium CG12_big_fil_rev_8_21_14_0_65_38_15]|nr:MAG: NADP(H)-dependent aldo-keto reductase [Bdellovibrionales bacterium CG22_combo_CG10-13_8_21_14_all_38_13]PIQ56888.1 MAG: NADP(H)-dependent aldo-keto reductase [Bdellovibrionales bacterium CG12_big_fil_rev_8_21_14_0_65_38_15]PIR30053.1 MAG: NADP(H)-dependent aldo-keto reductase [Bdellovibrionales bacterium CG11_big_fil_rev_8_21_14_0_20_38_13]
MELRPLGHSNIKVSKICLGTMTWGEQNTQEEAHDQLDLALDFGVNFIDTAEMYPVPPMKETCHATEQIIGLWKTLHSKRDQIILATKVVGPGFEWIRGGPRLTRGQVRKALEDSLKRLQTDYIDLYQVHWPDRHTNFFGSRGFTPPEGEEQSTPIQETLSELAALQKEGKIREFGLSNETAWGVHEWLRLADQGVGPRPVSIQNPYSLLNRLFEVGLAEFSYREKVGLLAYSPLAFGMLTGKYDNGAKPKNARLTLFDRFTRYNNEKAKEAAKDYNDLAKSVGLTPAQMALAFVTSRHFTTSNIIGATTMAQLAENLSSATVNLSEDVLNEIEKIYALNPNPAP